MVVHASDIYPRDKNIVMQCVLKTFPPRRIDYHQPPWDRDILYRLIEKVVAEDRRLGCYLMPTGAIKQSIPFMPCGKYRICGSRQMD